MKKYKYVLGIGITCFALSIAITAQINTVNHQKITSITNDRETNELRSQLLKEQEKYDIKAEQTQALQNTLDKIRDESVIKNEELNSLNEEINNYNNLAGLNNVVGEGIIITVMDSKLNTSTYFSDQKLLLVHYSDLLMIINELNNAGAEAISVNGQRIVDSSAINCSGNIITINNKKIRNPFEIKAIGNINQLLNLNRPNGYLSLMKKDGLDVSVKQDQKVTIEKFNGVIDYEYVKVVGD